uniref:Si:ch211-154e10.1 n=1 Tax=Paramormyrops kingsleyae TaxID=1676925 RepID=A0A3B3RRV2_9TELE
GGPSVSPGTLAAKPAFEGLIHRPSYKSSGHEPTSPPSQRWDKTLPVPPLPGQHRQSRRMPANGSEGRGGLWGSWRERRNEPDDKDRSQTLKGARVTSPPGDKNYIILAPINPGSQILRPVYQDRISTLGEPSSSPGFPGRTTFLRRSTGSKTSRTLPTPAGHQQNCNYANYQNCTVVHSHLPHGSYSTYVKLTPKILIFPIFVQPLDLCNPARTLLVTEEMILHESKHLSIKVTVFIYTDLMLVTREDEPGRCNVLQNPLFLKHLRLREGFPSSSDLQSFFFDHPQKCDCLLSLEAYSTEQKRRVYQCLGDHIEKQLQHREVPTTPEKVGPGGGAGREGTVVRFRERGGAVLSILHIDTACSYSWRSCSQMDGHLSSFNVFILSITCFTLAALVYLLSGLFGESHRDQ